MMKISKFLDRALNYTIRYCVYVVQIIIWILTAYAPYTRSKKLPPIDNDLLLMSATQLAEKIRTRKIKCEQVIEAYIERIKQVDPVLNGMIQNRFKDAMKEALAVDKMLEERPDDKYWRESKPLLGVPLTVKETIAVKGMSNNAGRSRVSERTAGKDAVVVDLLKGAGMIVVAVTNIPELCANWETDNSKHGRTNNPYDTRRTPGGSSGGEGAFLGAAASVTGIGSDLGGSLRLPAMFCGVFSHKATPGFICNDGHIPSSPDPRWPLYFTLGPLARYSEDLAIMIKLMIPQENRPELLKLDEQVNIQNLNIFYMEGEGSRSILTDPISGEIKEALTKSVYYLKTKYSTKPKKILMKGIQNCVNMSHLILGLNGIENIFQVDDNHPDVWNSVTLEILKKLTFQSSASTNAILYGPLKIISNSLPYRIVKKMEEKKEKLRAEFNKLLGDSGVLLYPTFPHAAPYHGRMGYMFLNAAYMLLFNFMGLPVTQCPLGLNREGLPIGIQIIAGQNQDRLCLAVASALERGFGGWRPPPSECK